MGLRRFEGRASGGTVQDVATGWTFHDVQQSPIVVALHLVFDSGRQQNLSGLAGVQGAEREDGSGRGGR